MVLSYGLFWAFVQRGEPPQISRRTLSAPQGEGKSGVTVLQVYPRHGSASPYRADARNFDAPAAYYRRGTKTHPLRRVRPSRRQARNRSPAPPSFPLSALKNQKRGGLRQIGAAPQDVLRASAADLPEVCQCQLKRPPPPASQPALRFQHGQETSYPIGNARSTSRAKKLAPIGGAISSLKSNAG